MTLRKRCSAAAAPSTGVSGAPRLVTPLLMTTVQKSSASSCVA